jgi:hypothetical protein
MSLDLDRDASTVLQNVPGRLSIDES